MINTKLIPMRLIATAVTTMAISIPVFGAGDESKADNTAANKAITHTAQDQSNAQSDLNTTAKIRQEVVRQKDFSISAKNIKIITAGGRVTLVGPVKNAAEKLQVEQIAKSVAGAAQVTSQIEIAR